MGNDIYTFKQKYGISKEVGDHFPRENLDITPCKKSFDLSGYIYFLGALWFIY